MKLKKDELYSSLIMPGSVELDALKALAVEFMSPEIPTRTCSCDAVDPVQVPASPPMSTVPVFPLVLAIVEEIEIHVSMYSL